MTRVWQWMRLLGHRGYIRPGMGETDGDRIQRLLHALEGEANRRAQFVCVIAIARPDGAIALQAEGICPGEVLTYPRGSGGFGYDPIFFVPDQQMTFAEMPAAVKHQVSHRGRAFAQLIPQLPQVLVG